MKEIACVEPPYDGFSTIEIATITLMAFAAIYYLGHMWNVFKKTRKKQATKQDLLSEGINGAVALILMFSIWVLGFTFGILEG